MTLKDRADAARNTCCGEELVGTGGFYRRYRVCKRHSQSPSLPVAGIQQRFCQQCARFHPVDDFEPERRSCKAALERHRSKRRSSGRSGGSHGAGIGPFQSVSAWGGSHAVAAGTQPPSPLAPVLSACDTGTEASIEGWIGGVLLPPPQPCATYDWRGAF
ncbi:squamosa promoter-binding 9 [Micractinium conductrix]|uniref:Squamosa promoter-binding 9 n=1 Tax=Micractinium conductrix TaxID=554055 RepID=A0A2P6VAY2_9CHLO|nr:squamosa promoter-binding 9 [Micractinium conductrix]|eukprot:PSC71250.1 squamosa promoter-binding 9 [Micractinium conductrix]